MESKKIVGEITPYYMFHPKAAKRIQITLPDTKIIAILRDPAQRAISQYFHACRRGYENLTLEQAIEAEHERLASGSMFSHQKHSYISRSKYVAQLEAYEALFPAKRILIIKSEEMFADPERAWKGIQEFLGLEYRPLTIKMPKANSGKGESKKVEPETIKLVKTKLKSTYHNMKTKYGISW